MKKQSPFNVDHAIPTKVCQNKVYSGSAQEHFYGASPKNRIIAKPETGQFVFTSTCFLSISPQFCHNLSSRCMFYTIHHIYCTVSWQKQHLVLIQCSCSVPICHMKKKKDQWCNVFPQRGDKTDALVKTNSLVLKLGLVLFFVGIATVHLTRQHWHIISTPHKVLEWIR